MNTLLIGIDGGGTKTTGLLQNDQGQMLATATAGPGNLRRSVTETWQSIHTLVDSLLNQAGIPLASSRIHLGLGMAGSTEAPSMRAQFLATPHPYETLVLNTDAYIACLGAHAAQAGAILIMGTGSVGFQIDSQGRETRAGGYGFPYSDEGSGAWLGMRLVRALFHAGEGHLAWTPFLKEAFSRFDHQLETLAAFATSATPADFASLVPLFTEGLAEQDPFALQEVRAAAQAIDQLWMTLTRQTSDCLSCCLLGGLASMLEPYLSEALKVRLIPPRYTSPEGAIMMLRTHLGLPPLPPKEHP